MVAIFIKKELLCVTETFPDGGFHVRGNLKSLKNINNNFSGIRIKRQRMSSTASMGRPIGWSSH
jgi:hypothetical protein